MTTRPSMSRGDRIRTCDPLVPNLRNNIDGLAADGSGAQASEIPGDGHEPIPDAFAPSGLDETPFGAPVVRERPPDLGPHERLINVRFVAARLGVSPASVYKLVQRGELRGMRIGGTLRFSPQAIDEYAAQHTPR